MLGGALDANPRDTLRKKLLDEGSGFVGQEPVTLSTAPIYVDGRLEPRPITLRVYAARTAKGWTIMSHIKRQIVTILKDETLEDNEKVEVLRQLEADTLSKERSATEGMTPVDGDDGEDLKAIEQALRKLGEHPVEAGANSL